MIEQAAAQAYVTYQAHHALLLAIPAVVPALIVAGIVVFVAARDRRTPDDEVAGEGVPGQGIEESEDRQ